MKTFSSIITLFFLFVCTKTSNAQPWSYAFGLGTGSSSVAGQTVLSNSGGYLPSTQANGGTIRTYVGTGGGSFNLENPGSTLGNGTEMRAVASTTGSRNKFSCYDWGSPSNVATIKFNVRFAGGNFGEWIFSVGDGTYYNDNNAYSDAQSVIAFRFVYSALGITTYYRNNAGAWIASGVIVGQNLNRKFEFYINNSNTTRNYTHGFAQTVAANRVDFYMDGILIENDLIGTGTMNNANIDSWAFTGTASTGNVANLYLDNISYTNTISPSPLPIELLYFNAKEDNTKVELSWATVMELNNDRFQIERSENGVEFENISEIKGAGDSKEVLKYSYFDEQPLKGTSYYRLKQIDHNGISETFETVSVKLKSKGIEITKIISENNGIDLQIFSDTKSKTQIIITDITGKNIAEQSFDTKPGYQNITIPLSAKPSGIHFIRLINKDELVTKKIIL